MQSALDEEHVIFHFLHFRVTIYQLSWPFSTARNSTLACPNVTLKNRCYLFDQNVYEFRGVHVIRIKTETFYHNFEIAIKTLKHRTCFS